MAQQFKLVMAQLNLLVGDIDANADRVIAAAQEAKDQHDAQMVVFPELTLTGYPPEDLLFRPSLKLRVDRALQRILAAGLDSYVVLGYPEQGDGVLYNALAVIKGDQLVATYHKQRLPSYEVFDEHRYFQPGHEACVVNIAGSQFAFTICEDMWDAQPVAQARAAGAQLMININASPFHQNKLNERQALLQRRSDEGGFPIVYVNLVGGQDELVFDGSSMAVDAEGNCCRLAPGYEEGLYPLLIDIADDGSCGLPPQEIAPPLDLEAQVYQALVLGVRDYVNKNGFPGVVLGLSGGIDSALTLAVAVDALGRDRVHAVMMPFEYTSQLSLDVAAEQAKGLGVDYRVIAINEIYDALIKALESEFAETEPGIAEQNMQARARGVLLMAISNKKGFLVLTTGNKSEIAVGYSTLYGDMAGGFDALKDVSKTLVYRLARYRNSIADGEGVEVIPELVITRPPSAELAPGQVDQDSLPPYDVLDQILELYVEQDCSAATIIDKGFEAADVKRVLRLVDLNEYKRRQSPVGVRITRKGFGRDRRYPITNAWPLGE